MLKRLEQIQEAYISQYMLDCAMHDIQACSMVHDDIENIKYNIEEEMTEPVSLLDSTLTTYLL